MQTKELQAAYLEGLKDGVRPFSSILRDYKYRNSKAYFMIKVIYDDLLDKYPKLNEDKVIQTSTTRSK